MTACDYIPAIDESYRLFLQFDKPYWVAARRVPIESIKIDKSLMSFANEIWEERVETIITCFDDYQWLPISVSADYFLLDGQHRLAAAKRMNLKFIDTVIRNDELHQSPTKHSRKRKGTL